MSSSAPDQDYPDFTPKESAAQEEEARRGREVEAEAWRLHDMASALIQDLGLPADATLQDIEQELEYLRLHFLQEKNPRAFDQPYVVGKKEVREARARCLGLPEDSGWYYIYHTILERNGPAVQEIRNSMEFDFQKAWQGHIHPYEDSASGKRSNGEVASAGSQHASKSGKFEISNSVGSVAASTHFGGPMSKYGQHNEDTVFISACREQPLAVGVIDGAGGSGKGELASCIALASLAHALRQQKSLPDAFQKARADVTRCGMGGDAAAVVVQATKHEQGFDVVMMWAGDCKAMTVRQGTCLREGTTVLQNMAQRAIDTHSEQPESLYNSGRLHVLTGSLKLRETTNGDKPGMLAFKGQKGDMVVAASDGLWDVASEYEVVRIVQEGGTPLEIQEKIFKLAFECNNSKKPFNIDHAEGVQVSKTVSRLYPPQEGFPTAYDKRGDNITVAVMQLG